MKAGRQGLDNGWIQFTNVRVPRENMLMRWAQVTADGQFIPPKNLAISYMTLIGERLLTLEAVNIGVGQCVTIATRYACVRTQGEKNQKIMDFQSHQYRLLPIIACVYATHCVFRYEMIDTIHFVDMYLMNGRKYNHCIKIRKHNSNFWIYIRIFMPLQLH